MFRRFFAIILSVILTSALAGAAATPAKAVEHCSAEQGQMYIEQGRYNQAIRVFSCLVDAAPTEVEGYRGRIEAELLLGRYSDAVLDYARVTALVIPVHPDARNIILSGYAARLDVAPQDVNALTGASFARWWFFDYAGAINQLNRLLDVRPDDVYGNLFRGSSRLLKGGARTKGIADLDRALALAPQSADVRYIVSDAYTYGLSDPQRAFAEASLALSWGLDTPRVHAILASAYVAFGDDAAAATHFKRHIDLVTNELLVSTPIGEGESQELPLVPYRTYEIPVPATAGTPISIGTSSHDFGDTILVLLAPDGTPVVGGDDNFRYFAAIDWTPPQTGVYRLRVTSFESVSTGDLVVSRD